MFEYIEKKALRDTLYDADAITMAGVKILNQFPSADVVHVVRCEVCEYWKRYDEDFPHMGDCTNLPDLVGLDRCKFDVDFCSEGVPKEGAE